MSVIINTRQIATDGLGEPIYGTIWRTAFPSINFYELFPEPDAVKLIRPYEVPFEEEVGSLTITVVSSELPALISGSSQAQAGGVVNQPRQARKQVKHDEYNWKRVTRVRTYSIPETSHVNNISVVQIISTKSISSNLIFGIPSVNIGINDEEEILMMLMAA